MSYFIYCYAECCYAESHCADCHFAECCNAIVFYSTDPGVQSYKTFFGVIYECFGVKTIIKHCRRKFCRRKFCRRKYFRRKCCRRKFCRNSARFGRFPSAKSVLKCQLHQKSERTETFANLKEATVNRALDDKSYLS